MADLLIKNPSQITTLRPGPFRGPEAFIPEVREGDSILIKDGLIHDIGPWDRLAEANLDCPVMDAAGCAVIPGFTDCHTHPVFGGNRADEFAMRTAGVSYQEIAEAGGGIARTVAATRAASKGELKEKAAGYLQRALKSGTCTMEAKTGYGLDLETELKMLEVITELDNEQPIDLIPTFLGAHAVPEGMSTKRYVDMVKEMIPDAARYAKFCDVFCETGYFSPEQSMDILEAAAAHGMLPRLHANQFTSSGCIQAAVELGAVSVEHLEVLDHDEIELLAESDLFCVMLPGVSLFLDIPFAPGRTMIDAGCLPALASDFNPGSNMCLNLQLIMTLACTRMSLSVDEALACTTRNAARALRLEDRGVIAQGAAADLLVLDIPDYREMVYFYGENHVAHVIKNGVAVC